MKVRVMSFAYNAKVKYSKSTADIFEFADQLLEGVLAKRDSDEEATRPLVFICHSLGGIIFKQVGDSPWPPWWACLFLPCSIHTVILGLQRGQEANEVQ